MWPARVRGCLIPLSWVYGAIVRLRAWLYGAGILPRHRLPCRVISIGNLTVGGTGKTPVAIFVVSALIEKGYRVGVLSRGYRRSGTQAMVLVSDGRNVLVGPEEGGDEPVLIGRRCPQAVVAVGADRVRLGRWVLSQRPLDVLVLDDGFQHLRLARDVDLLLLDAGARTSLDRLLPAGRLREPLTAASRASAWVVTRSEHEEATREILSSLAKAGVPPRPMVRLRFVPETVLDLQGRATEPLSCLKRRRAVIVCALANPTAFRRAVEDLGVQVLDACMWPDHHAYTSADAARVLETAGRGEADLVLTTEKDAVKLAPLAAGGPLELMTRVLRLGVEVVEGRSELDRMLAG